MTNFAPVNDKSLYIMVHELYLSKADARRYADEFANEIGGWVKDEISSVDDRTSFDYKDREIQDFAGECPAFQVIDADGSLAGLYGYTED